MLIVDVVGLGQLRKLQSEEAFASLVVGHVDIDDFVDAACAQCGTVDALGMVRRRQHIDALL